LQGGGIAVRKQGAVSTARRALTEKKSKILLQVFKTVPSIEAFGIRFQNLGSQRF
jgi:hypothetical protein